MDETPITPNESDNLPITLAEHHIATELWMTQNLKILDKKTNNLIPFVPNDVQEIIYQTIYMQRSAGKPVRIIILKSRREGVSTATAGYFFARTNETRHHQAFVAAQDDEGCKTQWAIVKRYNENLPESERREQQLDGTRLGFKHPHSAVYRVQTAGNQRLGSGAGYVDLHLSELAKWTHDSTALTSIMQTVPEEPNTTVIIESTAFGMGGSFYDMWNAAVRWQKDNPGNLDGFLPLFFTSLTEEHSKPVPDGYQWGVMDEAELQWKDAGATPEQLYWRRWKIETYCKGDVDIFNQEYPLTPEVAFLSTGRPAISAEITRHHRANIMAPSIGRMFEDNTQPNGVRLEFGGWRGDEGGWEIMEPVREGHDYTVGADLHEGLPTDPANPESDRDWSGILVFDRVEKRYVALHMSRLDADRIGHEMHRAARYYNNAWVSPELNAGPGVTALKVLREEFYPRTYHREADGDSVDLDDVGKLGWRTSRQNRDDMINDYIALCRKDPVTGWEFSIINQFERLVEQEESFIYNRKGKREHRPGGHDDLLIAAMIAVQLHLRCCRTLEYVSIGVIRDAKFTGPEWFGGRDPGVREERSDMLEVEVLS